MAVLQPLRTGDRSVEIQFPHRWRASTPTMPEGPRHNNLVEPRRQATIVLGGLAGRQVGFDAQRVPGRDLDGHTVWVDSCAVWDVGRDGACRPVAIGLATGTDRTSALLQGLSDRLGWEAVTAWGDGAELRPAPQPPSWSGEPLTLLDGRLDHDVPTVVAITPTTIRFGAGHTWDAAVGRALWGSSSPAAPGELDAIRGSLESAGLEAVAVDLASGALARAGIVRLSVQLVCRDTAVRGWDGAGAHCESRRWSMRNTHDPHVR